MNDAAAAVEGTRSRRERNKARTRATILSASLACITEAGLQATTMDQIAAAADVARATLFNYFPSKGDIVEALIADSDSGFFLALESWRRTPDLSTGARLLGLFAATAYALHRAPARRRALIELSWMHWAEPRSVPRVRRVREAFTTLLDDGRERGDVPEHVDTVVAADIIANAYMGIVHSWWMEEAEAAAERFAGAARLLAQMVCPGVELPATPPLPRPAT